MESQHQTKTPITHGAPVITSQVNDLQKVWYTGRVSVTGGRDGRARSSDGQLDLGLSQPGSKKPGSNPEQLLAAGWSACFIGAMQLNAPALGVALPEGTRVEAEVDLATGTGGYFISARLQVILPGLDDTLAAELVKTAHGSCPYSKATKGNINVDIRVVV